MSFLTDFFIRPLFVYFDVPHKYVSWKSHHASERKLLVLLNRTAVSSYGFCQYSIDYTTDSLLYNLYMNPCRSGTQAL